MSIFFDGVKKNLSAALSDLENLDHLIPEDGWINDQLGRRLKDKYKKIDMSKYDAERFQMLLRATEKDDVELMRHAEGIHSRLASREKNNLTAGNGEAAEHDRKLRESIIKNANTIRNRVSDNMKKSLAWDELQEKLKQSLDKALASKTRLQRGEQFRHLREILRSAEKILREAILLEGPAKIEQCYEEHINNILIDEKELPKNKIALGGGHTHAAFKLFESKIQEITGEKFTLNQCEYHKEEGLGLEEFIFPDKIGAFSIKNRVKCLFPLAMGKEKICALALEALNNSRKRSIMLNIIPDNPEKKKWTDEWVGEAGGFFIVFKYAKGTREGEKINEAKLNTFFPILPRKVKGFDSTVTQ